MRFGVRQEMKLGHIMMIIASPVLVWGAGADEKFLQSVGGVAIISKDDLEPIRGGYRIDRSKVKPVVQKKVSDAAISGLKKAEWGIEGVDVFAYSLGIHLLLSEAGEPVAWVSTSSAPQVDLIKVKLSGRWVINDDTCDPISRGSAPDYYRALAKQLSELVADDPIANSVLKGLIKKGEQDVAQQSATRAESNPEGDNKPQPESEERSR
jgi:hypothetical protein